MIRPRRAIWRLTPPCPRSSSAICRACPGAIPDVGSGPAFTLVERRADTILRGICSGTGLAIVDAQYRGGRATIEWSASERRRRSAMTSAARDAARSPGFWMEPRTGRVYPLTFAAYRRQREAEEQPRRGHRAFGPYVDSYVWRRWGHARTPDVDIVLTLRAGTSPRIRRLVTETLGLIKRGRSAAAAIRQVSRRFGLRQTRTRACLAACIAFTAWPRGDALTRLAERPWLS
jgi:hypothetical protein